MSEGISNTVPSAPECGPDLLVGQTLADTKMSLKKGGWFVQLKPYLAPF